MARNGRAGPPLGARNIRRAEMAGREGLPPRILLANQRLNLSASYRSQRRGTKGRLPRAAEIAQAQAVMQLDGSPTTSIFNGGLHA